MCSYPDTDAYFSCSVHLLTTNKADFFFVMIFINFLLH